MSNDQIVIVTQMSDPHADDLILALGELGQEPIRLNTDDIPLNTSFSLAFESASSTWKGAIKIKTNGRVIDPENIRSIWWRRPDAFNLPLELSEQEREFAQDELEHSLRGLWASLDCYWISQASWKGEQIPRAAQMGFDVPRTLITTDPEQAKSF